MFAETSRISVPAESEQAGVVRQFVRLACHRYGCDAVTDNVLQVTDELVGSAFSHCSGPGCMVDVGIIPTQRGVRVEVHDRSRDGDRLAPATGDEPSVFQIVATLAAEWGVDDGTDGTTVWAELTGGDPHLLGRVHTHGTAGPG
ncbi:MAG TPA: ATP-binding protein [Frankiaceae bacterium]|nr:ATP-binding protein [Frankiaceae bacterium]